MVLSVGNAADSDDDSDCHDDIYPALVCLIGTEPASLNICRRVLNHLCMCERGNVFAPHQKKVCVCGGGLSGWKSHFYFCYFSTLLPFFIPQRSWKRQQKQTPDVSE